MPKAKSTEKKAPAKKVEKAKTAPTTETKKKTTKKAKKKDAPKEPSVKAVFARERILTEDCDPARELCNRSGYGQILEKGKVQLSLMEALYLLEKGKISILDGRGKAMELDTFLRKAKKVEPKFWVRYCVFKDMRNRGYIIKTALKFGADFRVYDRGIKPGEDHARWVVYAVHEGEVQTWHEFAAKNRVAHSTKKRLLIAVVDDEGDVSFWEVRWMRP